MAVCVMDFGTSNSLVAAATKGEVLAPVPLSPGEREAAVMRSVLFTEDGEHWCFGAEAIARYGEGAATGRIFRSLKRFLPDASFSGTKIGRQELSIVDLVSKFIRRLKARAEEHYGLSFTRVVLGRPAIFSADAAADQLAEQRLAAAARQAGFIDVHFCPEPVAAAHAFRRELKEPETVFIADFGGGTSDFTLLHMNADGFRREDVLAVDGVPVAGDAFDGAIMREVVSPLFGTQMRYRLPLGRNELSLPRGVRRKLLSPADINFLGRADIMGLLKDAQRWSLDPASQEAMDQLFVLVEEQQGYALFAAIEAAKVALSSAEETRVSFRYPGIQVDEALTRSAFAGMSRDPVGAIVEALDRTLERGGLDPKEVDRVCCTGGTAQVAALAEALRERFGPDKLSQYRHFRSVIEGLAAYGQELENTI